MVKRYLDKETLKQFISADRLNEAIKNLIFQINEFLDKNKNDFDYEPIRRLDDALIINSGKLNGLEHDKIMGILDRETQRITTAEIQNAVLQIIDRLPNQFWNYHNNNTNELSYKTQLIEGVELLHQQKAQFEYDVFICFSTKDREIAKPIWEILRGYGLRIFVSDENLHDIVGCNFLNGIYSALEKSQHLVLLASNNSLQSGHVEDEYQAFYNNYHIKNKSNRLLLAYLLGNLTIEKLPVYLRNKQIARHPEQIVNSLVKDIRTKRKEEERAEELIFKSKKIKDNKKTSLNEGHKAKDFKQSHQNEFLNAYSSAIQEKQKILNINSLIPEKLDKELSKAITLNKPLLIIGETGSFKNHLGYWVSEQLGFKQPLTFNVKRSSKIDDLLYVFDDKLFSLHSQNEKEIDLLNFIRLNALGIAIKENEPVVIQIADIEKATDDFIDDLFIAIEELRFVIKETGQHFQYSNMKLPIIIITCDRNHEIPDAVFRRCITYYLETADSNSLCNLIEMKFPDQFQNKEQIGIFVNLFMDIQKIAQKQIPTTVELFDWVRYIGKENLNNVFADSTISNDKLINSLSILLKSQEDMELVVEKIFKR